MVNATKAHAPMSVARPAMPRKKRSTHRQRGDHDEPPIQIGDSTQ